MSAKLLEKEFDKPLDCWGDIIVYPHIQENTNDVWLAIKYNDHGDTFWLIGTNEGSFFRYGYIVNRTCEFVRDEEWVRKPHLHKKEDERSHVSNRMYFMFCDNFKEKRSGVLGTYDYADKPRKYDSRMLAQIKFDSFMYDVKKTIEGDVMVHEDSGYGYNKKSIRKFLEVNEIDTEENLKKLEEQPFTTRIDGIDGSAGKVKFQYDILWCDDIEFVYVNGKVQDPEKAPTYESKHEDEWGYRSIGLNLKSYRRKSQ